jgi:hypothetical protein
MLNLLDPAEYDRAEMDGADGLPNRVIECSQTEVFTLLGYPTRVRSLRSAWRFADVMHEGRLRQTFYHYLGDRITPEEMDICRDIAKTVWRLSNERYARPVVARDALARALVVLRHVQYLFPKGATVFEIGAGSGYLGALLALAGYRYVSTDICQGFYVFQSHLLQACTSGRLIELATDPRHLSDIKEIPAGSALHVPWWKWMREGSASVLAADVVSANHCLCEMHPRSMAYNVKMAALMLRAAGKDSAFVFESWGWQYHPAWTVTKTFADNGLAVGHVDPMIAVFVAADSPKVGLRLPIAIPPSQPKKTWFGQTAAVASSQEPTEEAAFTLPERLSETNPLSAQIAKGRAETAARARFGADDFESMLKEVSGVQNSQSDDQQFLEFISRSADVVAPRRF